MMTVTMDSSSAPSSSRELVHRLFRKNIELENGLQRSAQSKVPSYPNAWLQMRENYETIILEDHDFSEKREVEYLLWQLHYRRIDDYRQRINAAVAAGSNASPGVKGLTRPDSIKKIRSGFKVFLTEATGFYHELMLKIRAKFGLPLSYLTEGPENVTKDEKRSTELKKGLVSCHQCLIYLGDLARYKGLYGEGESVSRDYAAASSYYVQAASLCPSNGNPHHQLAILASYLGNEILAIYCYFRSLAVESPFSTARGNLIIAFEKNRQSFSQLPVNVKVISARALATHSAGKVRGKGDSRLLAKDDKTETPSTKEQALNMSEEFKAFCTRFVRLNGILFTRTSLETFGEIFSLVAGDFNVLLSSGPEEELNFGPTATENALVILRFMAILIFTVHNVKRESENQSYAEILQRKVLLESAFTAAFEFAGYILKRCVELHDAASSYFLPSILVFIEWLACHPDIAGGADVDEKQAGARSFYWNQCIPFLNKLISTGLASIDGNDDTCDFNMDRYDGGTGNNYALWEDFELRGFLPLVPAQLILDFSRNESYEGDDSMKNKKLRVQRILAAGRSLMSIVLIDQRKIYIDPNLKKFVVSASPPTFKCLVNSSFSSMPESIAVEQVILVESVSDLDATHCSTPNFGIFETNPYSLVEGEEDEEEIVFKPIVSEKHTNVSIPISAACKLIDSAQVSSMGVHIPYVPQKSAPLDNFQMPTAVNVSSILHSGAPNMSNTHVQYVNPNASKWLRKQEASLSDGMKNMSMMENSSVSNHIFHEGFINVQDATVACIVPPSSSISTSILPNQAKTPEVMLPSVHDTVVPVTPTTDGMVMKLPTTVPSSRKNPVSRPVRYLGPPPGFGHLAFEQQNVEIPNSVAKDQHSEVCDLSWVEDIVKESSISQSALLHPHLTSGTTAFTGASSFPFPGKQVPDVQAHVVNEQKWKHFQLFEQLNPYAEKQLQQANLQQELLPEQHQAQSLWSGLYFV